MHPTHDELIGLVHGTLDEQLADTVAAHIEACDACEETVRKLETVADDVIQQLRTPATPGHFEAEPGCRDLVSVVAAIGRDLSVEPTAGTMKQVAEPELGVIRDYQLLSQIGEGGMGAVYKALHTRLQKVVALKVLPAGRMNDPQAVQRFEREMQAVGRLSHPNIVGAHDAGEHEGTHFLVMEHVDGLDLSGLIRNLGPLPIADACELTRQAAVGLQHAHEHDLVHRDIKPSNLMLGPDGLVKILDLGLARLHMGDQPELTSTGQMMGTLDYIAPEQTGDSHDVDIRADIFSLGATLYRLLTGVTPYSDPKYNTAVKRLAALANVPIPPVQDRRDGIPAELAAVVSRMLAKNPDERFDTPAEVARALELFAAGAEPAALLSSARQATPEEDAPISVENSTAPHLSSFTDTDSYRNDSSNVPSEAFDDASKPATPELEPTFIQPAAGTSRSTRTPRRTIVACALVGLGILLSAVIVFRLNLPAGTIVLECDPAALAGAKIEINGEEVTINLAGDNQPVTIGVDDKRGELRITKAGFKVFTKDFEIAVGEDEHSINVRFEPLQLVAEPDATAPQWQPGPAENVMPGLIPRPASFAGIKRWQIETALPRGAIHSAEFSPDGRLLACGTDTGQVRIYDAETLELVDLIVGFTTPVRSVAWSPDGQWLVSAGEEPVLRLWDTQNNRSRTIALDGGQVHAISWAPDSNRFAIANASPGNPTVQVWTVTGKRVNSLSIEGGAYILAAAWAPDGDWLVGGSNTGQVRLWNTETWEPGPIAQIDGGVIQHIAWSPDSKRFATADRTSNKIRVWNTDATIDMTLEGAGDAQSYSIAWSPRGDMLLSSGSQIKVHDLADTSKSVVIPSFASGNIFGVCWHPDGDRFASVDAKCQISLWNRDGALQRAVSSHYEASHTTVNWSHDGNFLASTSDGQPGIWLWNTQGVSQAVIKGGRPIAWHPTKSQIAGRDGKDLQLWDSQGKLLSTAVQTNSFPWSAAWSPDGKLLAVGDSYGLVEIREPGGKRLATLEGHESGKISDIAWSPDGSALVTGCSDNTARFWKRDGTPGIVMKQLGQCRSVAWKPSGDRIAVSSDTTVIWNLDGTSGPALKGLANSYSVDWSPDGKRFVTGSHDRTVRLWSDEGLPQSVLREHDGVVYSVDWSPTGSHLASAANDGTVIVWDAETTEPVWVGVQLSTGDSATFSAAGQVLDGDPDVIEENFVYLVENEDGQQELLKPSEFQQRIGSKTATPDSDPDRIAAEWVLSIGGKVFLRSPEDDDILFADGKLPQEPFFIHAVDLQSTPTKDSDLVQLARLSRVVALYLTRTHITGEGLKHLAPVKSLRILNLSAQKGLGEAGFDAINQLENLTTLAMDSANCTDEQLMRLTRLSKLGVLAVARNPKLTNRGIEFLLRRNPLLQQLQMNNEPDGGTYDPSCIAHAPRLERLTISASQLNDAALTAVADHPTLSWLNVVVSTKRDEKLIDQIVSLILERKQLTHVTLAGKTGNASSLIKTRVPELRSKRPDIELIVFEGDNRKVYEPEE